jgi:hypothetical protein
MTFIPSLLKFLWKIPVVVGALLVGAMAANQAGWSGGPHG